MKRTAHPLNTTPSLLDNLADAALIGALLTVLAFQEFRVEGYETEKVGLLVIFGGVIFGVRLVRILEQPQVPLRNIVSNPITLGVLLLIVISALSTLFSLSPAVSWWGAHDRANGLLTLLVYGLLFVQASISGWRVLTFLLPVLVVCAITLSIFALLIQFGLNIGRPGSLTGNPNYLSAWLVMAIVIMGYLVVILARRWAQNWPLQRRIVIALLIGVMMLMVGTVILAASRGALLALLTGVATSGVLWASLTRKRRVLIAGAVLTVILGIGYIVIALNVDSQVTGGVERLFVPYDPFRQEAWQAARIVIIEQTTPLPDYEGQPDPYAGLRLLVGYGPETISQTQSRFDPISTLAERTYLNSFHNMLFDAVITLGIPGLLVWLLIYWGGVYLCLKVLFGMEGRAFWRWVAALLIGAVGGVIVFWRITPDLPFGTFLPLGAVAGLLIWIGSYGFSTGAPVVLDERRLMLMALLSVMVIRWVDNQFGFTQAASDPLWWILLGLLVHLRTNDTSSAPGALLNTQGWQIVILAAGVFLLHGFGVSIHSDTLAHAIGLRELPILMLIVLGAGMLFALLLDEDRSMNGTLLLLTVLIWGVFYGFKLLANEIGGNALDTSLAGNAASVSGSFAVLSFKGILAAIIILGVWALSQQRALSQRLQMNRLPVWAAGIVVITLIFGSAYYASTYTGTILHSIGNSLSATNQPGLVMWADRTYHTASSYIPQNPRLHLDWAFNAAKQGDLAAVEAHVDELFAIHPYFNNSLEWDILEATGAVPSLP